MDEARRERAAFIDAHVARIDPLMRDTYQAGWDAEVTGSEADNERVAKLTAELLSVYADPEAYGRLRAWAAAPTGDPLLDRQIHLLYLAYAGAQQDEATIRRLTELEKDVRSTYVNYRGVVDGRSLSDNELTEIMSTSTSSDDVRAAWEAGKQVGQQVRDRVLQLVRLRNEAARRMGFPDHWRKDIQLAELDEAALFALLDDLAAQTDAPFARAKAELDAALARRFGVAVDELRPWHYGDPFFQRPPSTAGGLDALFADKKLEELAIRTYDGLGLEVRPILDRSDLYERPGKNQHAFCTCIDRRQDIRILCNLQPNERWMETLLHELGHAVYDQYLDQSLPFLLRTPSHILTTEAIAMLFGRLPLNGTWLREVVGVDDQTVAELVPRIQARQRLGMLIFVRWVLVMVHFERALYTDPDQDLNRLWWDLVERFQRLRRPEGRDAPDWAAKIHLALYPVYYQNYLLGELTASQLQRAMATEAGGIVGSAESGRFLRDRVFAPGATVRWDALIARATGAPLAPDAFVEEFARPSG